MSERDVIEQTGERPVTRAELVDDLRAAGLERGMICMVHSSMSALGWVVGGPVTVIEALSETLGDEGTLVMPTHSTQLGDPCHWSRPGVPESWWAVIREHAPAYDPAATPTRSMGLIAETFRRMPGVERSTHPLLSCAARGARAHEILHPHPLETGCGPDSPIERLYDFDASVLLLGVGHVNNTSLHLAEHRASYPAKRSISNGAPMLVDGERVWTAFEELDGDTCDFELLGEAFGERARQAMVGRGDALLMRQRQLVDFAVSWFETHRAQCP